MTEHVRIIKNGKPHMKNAILGDAEPEPEPEQSWAERMVEEGYVKKW